MDVAMALGRLGWQIWRTLCGGASPMPAAPPSPCSPGPLQAVEQPRIPPLRTVIMDRDGERLPLSDQHQQPLAPRDPGVNQVALQQHVVLRGQRNYYRRKLRSLRSEEHTSELQSLRH